MKSNSSRRIVFLDYLRVIACFMVMVVHSCEQFYFNAAGDFEVASKASAAWVTFFDSLCRSSVPLFVMASSYLLFPIKTSAGEFLKRRILKVGIPFLLFSIAYTIYNDGSFGCMLFNFPMATGGHLWFVPMLFGLYILMILISPWAEKATEKEIKSWICVWFFTTMFPYLRRLCAWLYGDPSFGAVQFLYGECPWNSFGAFQYVSGFFGYLLLGYWFRRFAPIKSWRKTIFGAMPLLIFGFLIVGLGFWQRIPFDGSFPLVRPYSFVVDLEMSWEFCSFGVALMTIGYFMIIRRIASAGKFYEKVIKPLSVVSYWTYLIHIFFLCAIMPFLKDVIPVPAAIILCSILTFFSSSLAGGVCSGLFKVFKLQH